MGVRCNRICGIGAHFGGALTHTTPKRALPLLRKIDVLDSELASLVPLRGARLATTSSSRSRGPGGVLDLGDRRLAWQPG